jgi:hypothetical protein
MRKQLSIVLVEGDHVPRELSALLVGMGVWVKSTWSTGLDAALAQTTPHLVVCGDPAQLPLLKRSISLAHPGTPLLLIADWDLTRAQRAVAGGLVEDLIPESLPATDIARRLETLAARRATRMPLRSTLTPPTRAGIHPLLPVDAGRDDQTPESRQDHPVPSRRPPPPPVRVMSHAPAQMEAPISSRAPAPPVRATRSVAPTLPPAQHGAPAQPWSPPVTTNAYPTYRPPPLAPAQYSPQYSPQYSAQYSAQVRAQGGYGAAPLASVPPSGWSPASSPPSSAFLSPDSAPPIQMITSTTTTARRSRSRRSGPGFTLGAALGVAASAAAFVGVIEFEPELRTLVATSASRVTRVLAEHDVQLPVWVARSASSTLAPKLATSISYAAPATKTVAAADTETPGAPIDLADLGTVETDTALGMSQTEAAVLFGIPDARLASCDEMLSGWEPPLPMIEADRPKHGAIHRRRAQERLVAGEPQKALVDLCKSARTDPAGPGTETLASVYLALRSLEHAETWVKHFLSMNPRSDSGRELLGDVANQRGKVAEARAVWLSVLDVDADAVGLQREVAKHWTQDAISALAARDLAQAERKLRRALTLDPTNPSAALLLSRVLERQGETTGSLAWAKRASELSR